MDSNLQFTSELFEKLVRKNRLEHEKFTEKQLAEVIRQALLAGDFERHVNVLHQQQIVYLPYARELALEFERDELRKQVADLERRMENIARETGVLQQLENAEARADASAADARNARLMSSAWATGLR
jgi:hypothetical protein